MARIGARTEGSIGNEGNGNRGQTYFDPATLIGTGTSSDSSSGESSGTDNTNGSESSGPGSGERRRGRPPGSKNRSKETVGSVDKRIDLDAIQFSLSGIHAMLASMMQAPEWKLSDEEASQIAKSYGRVARHFDMTMHTKSIDIGNFVVILTIIYGSRIGSTMARASARRSERRAGMQPGVPVQPPDHSPGVSTPSKRAVAPAGLQPLVRPRTEADNALLNEAITPMFN